jgi:translation elongation factor P/translation initiation factor 5A
MNCGKYEATPIRCEVDGWDGDKVQLLSVMSDDVNIMDTQYGNLVALQERKLEAMLEEMTQGKRVALRRRLDKMSTDLS